MVIFVGLIDGDTTGLVVGTILGFGLGFVLNDGAEVGYLIVLNHRQGNFLT